MLGQGFLKHWLLHINMLLWKKCQQTELNIVAYLSMNSLQYSYFSGGENLSCEGQSVQQMSSFTCSNCRCVAVNNNWFT